MASVANIYERVSTLPKGQTKSLMVAIIVAALQVTLFCLEISRTISSWWGESPTSVRSKRLALSQEAKGRFAHLPNSSDAFAQRKQDDIAWEDRHR